MNHRTKKEMNHRTAKPPKTPTWRLVRPFITQGSALRPSPFLAPPSFEPLRSFSKRGVSQLPAPHPSYPPIVSEPPRLSRHTSLGEKRREKPTRTIGGVLFLVLYARVLGPFHRRGKGRSVVCGGWRLQAGVVAKMVKWWWWWCCGDCSMVGVVA